MFMLLTPDISLADENMTLQQHQDQTRELMYALCLALVTRIILTTNSRQLDNLIEFTDKQGYVDP